MTAKILTFPALTFPALTFPDGVVLRSEVPPDALPTTDLTPPLANRLAHLCDAPKRKPRAKMRVEQLPVTCVKVPRKQHADLRTLSGVLTLDWKGDVPWTATFDPHDESIPNIVAPIEKLTRDGNGVRIACDEGIWVFAPLAEDEDDYGDEDEE